MSRAAAAGEGETVIGLICSELHELRWLVERVTCSANHNRAHIRRIIWALNEAAGAGEEEEEDGNKLVVLIEHIVPTLSLTTFAIFNNFTGSSSPRALKVVYHFTYA